jgi:hypothetical protein
MANVECTNPPPKIDVAPKFGVDDGPKNPNGEQKICSQRKYAKIASLVLKQLKTPTHNLTEVEKKDLIHRLPQHHSVEDLLPNYVTSGRLFEGDKGMLEKMKVVYGNLASIRQNLNLTFNNVLLSAMVSSNVTSNQRHIARSLGASRHYVKNVMVGWIHVDQIGENFFGGMP